MAKQKKQTNKDVYGNSTLPLSGNEGYPDPEQDNGRDRGVPLFGVPTGDHYAGYREDLNMVVVASVDRYGALHRCFYLPGWDWTPSQVAVIVNLYYSTLKEGGQIAREHIREALGIGEGGNGELVAEEPEGK